MVHIAKKKSHIEHDWLSLITQHGLFISEPILQTQFPEGPESVPFDKYRAFKKEWDIFQLSSEQDKNNKYKRWIDFLFHRLLGIEKALWVKKSETPKEAKYYLFEYDQELSPDLTLLSKDKKPLLLVMFVAPGKKIDTPVSEKGKWKVSPYYKLSTLCMETKIPIGIITNGDAFRVIHVKPTTGTSYFEWRAQDWYDEKSLLDSFYTLMKKERFFNDEKNLLIKFINESQERQLDVTDQLGEQMKIALDIFVRAIGDLNNTSLHEIFKNTKKERLYDMSLTVMMRLVFILYSEENGLLPHGNYVYENNYGLSHLVFDLQSRINDDEYMRKKDAWPRILSLFKLILDGCEHPDVNTIAYGGELFDHEKYSELEDPRLDLNNLTIWQILYNLTYAETKIGNQKIKQKVSYRTIDVEQIGSVYESLIGYTIEQANEPMVIFQGNENVIRPSSEFKNLDRTDLEEYIKNVTNKNANSIKKNLKEFDDKIMVSEDKGLDILKRDFEKRFEKFIVKEGFIEKGQLYITRMGALRKGSGTFYTPKEITRFLVKEALEPFVFEKQNGNRLIRNPKDILSLKICDPAMGSGAFLVQTIRYLAEKLVDSWSKISSQNPDKDLTIPYGSISLNDDKDEFIPENEDEKNQKARLLIAQHCIYGVDLNPMAVELAKVSIWLTTMSNDRPLTFLDHRLKCGNSIIGTNFALIKDISDEALWNDQKKDNKEASISKSLTGINFDNFISEILETRKFFQDRELTSDDVKRKSELYNEFQNENKLINRIKRVFNLWCTIWFWPYSNQPNNQVESNTSDTKINSNLFDFDDNNIEINSMKNKTKNDKVIISTYQQKSSEFHPPHTGEYREIALNILDPEKASKIYQLTKEQLQKINQVSLENKYFHWELEFPEIFFNEDLTRKKNEGFDAMLGNPPWERAATNYLEFFSRYQIDFRELEKNKAKEKMNEILNKDQNIRGEWEKYNKQFENLSNFVHNSNQYILQTSHVSGKEYGGHLDYYKLFLEKFYSLTRKEGTIGIIVPDSLNLYPGSKGLRHEFFTNAYWKYILTFINRKKIFPIDSREKFVLSVIFKRRSKNFSFANFSLTDPIKLDDYCKSSIKIDYDFVYSLSPESLSIMEIDNQDKVNLAIKIKNKNPFLFENIVDKWNLKFLSEEFNATRCNELKNSKGLGFKLYSGGNIWHYSNQFSEVNDYIEKNKVEEFLKSREISRMAKEFKIKQKEAQILFNNNFHFNCYRLGYRLVAANTNERTFISTIIPKNVVVDNSIPITIPYKYIKENELTANIHLTPEYEEILFILSIFNSFVMDFFVRLKVSENLNLFHIYQLPIPRFSKGNWYFDQLVPRVARLISINNEYSDLWEDLYSSKWKKFSINDGGTSLLDNWNEINPKWNEKCGVYGFTNEKKDNGDRAQLRAEIDALVAHLFNLSEGDFTFIMNTFPVLKRKEEGIFGEYISKKLCLKEFKRFNAILENNKLSL